MRISMIVVVAAVSAICHPITALGQTTPARSADTVEEITVTARKIAEDVQRVPISITALSGESLARQSVTDIQELQTTVPNLVLQQSNTDPQSLYLAIRGQRQNDTPPTVDPSVGLYVDGLYYPRQVGLGGALVDLDRVEVLRGPQGTLFGRNTTGGAISMYSKDPTDKFGGEVSAEYGNYDAWNLTGIVNIPISEVLSSRFVVVHNERGAYAHDLAGNDLGTRDDTYVRAKLRADMGSVTAVLTGTYQNDVDGQNVWQLSGLSAPTATSPAGGVATLEVAAERGLPFTPAGLAQAASLLQNYINLPRNVSGMANLPPLAQFRSETIGLDVKGEINSYLTARSITGFEHLDRHVTADSDVTPFTILDEAFTNRGSYFSQELQLLGGDKQLNWVAGAYFGDERDHYTEVSHPIPVLSPVSSPDISDAPIENKSVAGFTQANWQFIPDWRLTVGGRWSHDTRELVADNSVGGICVVPAAGYVQTTTSPASLGCPRAFRADFSKPSWLVSIDHQFTDDVFGYVKSAYGYRSGGLNFRGSTFAESFEPFQPETVTEFEAGAKWELLDHRLRINGAIFHDKYGNAQRSIIIPGPNNVPIGLTENAATAKVDGFELETSLRATTALTLSASAGYINPRYVSFHDVTGDRSDESFGVPKLTLSGSATYTVDTPVGPLMTHVDYRYQSEFDIEPEAPTLSQEHQGAYGLLDGRIQLTVKEWDFAIFGRNLTDKEYRSEGSTIESALGFNNVILGDPRTFGVSVKMHF